MSALCTSESIKDLFMPVFKNIAKTRKYLAPIASLLPRLETLHFWKLEQLFSYSERELFLESLNIITGILQRPHHLKSVVIHCWKSDGPNELTSLLEKLNIKYDFITH